MPAFQRHTVRWLLWLLLAALPMTGASAALSWLLGARHFHKPVAAVATATAHGHDHGHAHAHEGLFRHRHAPDDASVVAVEREAPAADSGTAADGAGAGIALQVLAPPGALAWATLSGLSHRRPAVAALDFRSHTAAVPLPPPRA